MINHRKNVTENLYSTLSLEIGFRYDNLLNSEFPRDPIRVWTIPQTSDPFVHKIVRKYPEKFIIK